MKFLHKLLRFFAKKILIKYQPVIVGVTGSVGKTSAKEAIAQAISCSVSVRANYKNYNNEIGVPLTIIGCTKSPGSSILGWLAVFAKASHLLFVRSKKYPQVLVLEMGADKPGDIAYLTDLAPCKVGVLTAIAHAHTEFLGSLQKIAEEKRIIISHLPKDGWAVLNFDSELVMAQASKTKAQLITYGLKDGADLRATDVALVMDEATGWPGGIRFKVTYKGNIVPVFVPGIISEPFVSAVLAALSVASTFGVNLVSAAECLRSIEPLAGHLRIIPGIKETCLIDDTYNSSPDAAKAALTTLAKIAPQHKGQRYAVLGDMLELGPETQHAHREIGFKVAEHGIDFLITVGEASKLTAQAAVEAGLSENQVARFDDSVSAGKFLQEKLQPGDVVLVKGSQGMRMEKIVKEVMANPLDAPKLLVRQSEDWLRR